MGLALRKGISEKIKTRRDVITPPDMKRDGKTYHIYAVGTNIYKFTDAQIQVIRDALYKSTSWPDMAGNGFQPGIDEGMIIHESLVQGSKVSYADLVQALAAHRDLFRNIQLYTDEELRRNRQINGKYPVQDVGAESKVPPPSGASSPDDDLAPGRRR
jgi:hypothetical protein